MSKIEMLDIGALLSSDQSLSINALLSINSLSMTTFILKGISQGLLCVLLLNILSE